jgi:hypothetical protein
VAGIVLDRTSLLRLVGAVLAEQNRTRLLATVSMQSGIIKTFQTSRMVR